LEISKESKKKTSTVVIVFVAVVMLVLGSTLGYLVGYALNSTKVNTLKDQLSEVQEEIDALRTERTDG